MKKSTLLLPLLIATLLIPQFSYAVSFSGEMGEMLPIEEDEDNAVNSVFTPFTLTPDMINALLKSSVIDADDIVIIQESINLDALFNGDEDRDDASPELLDEAEAGQENAANEEESPLLMLSPEQLAVLQEVINQQREDAEDNVAVDEPVAQEAAEDVNEVAGNNEENLSPEPAEGAVEVSPVVAEVINENAPVGEAGAVLEDADESAEMMDDEKEEEDDFPLWMIGTIFGAGILVAGFIGYSFKKKQ